MITTSKIKELVDAGRDNYEIARIIVNKEIEKYVPLTLDDLPDTATVGSEIEAIVECIEQGDYEDALTIAQESAELILEDEGFELNNDSEEDS